MDPFQTLQLETEQQVGHYDLSLPESPVIGQ